MIQATLLRCCGGGLFTAELTDAGDVLAAQLFECAGLRIACLAGGFVLVVAGSGLGLDAQHTIQLGLSLDGHASC